MTEENNLTKDAVLHALRRAYQETFIFRTYKFSMYMFL